MIKFLDIKNLTFKLQVYKLVVLTISNLMFKMEWIPKELKGMHAFESFPKSFKGTPFRWLTAIGIQYLPKHFGCRYVKGFKRLQFSCWVFGMWIDLPRKYEIKNKDNLWCR
jgi:hypothetical protein